MNIRFLLFRGAWENEGNLWALETSEDILLFSAGRNAPFLNNKTVDDWDYLARNKSKIKAILINNTIPRNCADLSEIYQELDLSVPIYGSDHTKIIFDYLFTLNEKIKRKFVLAEPNKAIKIGNFVCRFLPLTGYSLGNLAVLINYENSSFYYLTDFSFHNLSENDLLNEVNFFTQLKSLTDHQKKQTYLLTSCQSLRWNSNNSLSLIMRNLAQKDQNYFFLLYDFDWLHILELCELAQKWQSKVKVLNSDFFSLLKKITNKQLAQVLVPPETLTSENTIYLLVGSPANIEERLMELDKEKHFSPKDNFTYLVGTSPSWAGEEKIARMVDYLYQRKSRVLNFSRSETFSLGTSFADLKLILDVIQPQFVLTIQNSYKQKNYLTYLEKTIFLACANQTYLNLPQKKIYPLPEREKWETEKILAIQRQNLLQSGFLLVFILANWENGIPKIRGLKLETVAVSSAVNLKKIEERVKHWWEKKISIDFAQPEPPKNWKKRFERYLANNLEKHLNFEYDIELKEPVILLFCGESDSKNVF